MSSVKHIFVSSRFLLSPTCFDIRKQHCEILVGALRRSHYLYIIHNRATGEVFIRLWFLRFIQIGVIQ